MEESEEDISSEDSDNMDTMDTVIQKQFQEMIKRGIKPSEYAANTPRFRPIDGVSCTRGLCFIINKPLLMETCTAAAVLIRLFTKKCFCKLSTV